MAQRVLVTDAHSTAALAAVRSLGAAGFSVTTAGERERLNLAAHSRFSRRWVACPSASRHPHEYADALVQELTATRYDLLVPTTDTSVAIVARDRERFEALARVALAPAGTLEYGRDKRLTVEAARRVNVRVPATWTVDSPEALADLAPHLSYPCVVKPRFSRYWDGRGPLRTGTVRYATSPDALRTTFAELHRIAPLPLVQEYVTGIGTGVFVLAEHGEPRAVFAHRRVREANPTGGAASLSESIVPVERLVEPALRLLRSLGWHGVAMAEFKDPGEPHAPILMEINGRLWGSLPLSIASGVDFPALMADLFLGRALQPPQAYRIGVRCRHLRADMSHLAAVLKGRPAGWSGPFPSRTSTVAALLPWPGRWHSYNFRLTDPLPGLLEMWGIAADQAKALVARAQGGTRVRAAEEAP